MKLVIDANVGLSALLPEQDTAKAVQLFGECRKGTHELLSPGLYMLEVGNILVQSARRGKIPMNGLPMLYAELIRNMPIVYPSASLFPEAFQIASRIRVSVYDAVYLALSKRESCLLVTSDEKLIKAATGFQLVSLTAI